MRYHTAPLIGFTAYLERLRSESPPESGIFNYGNEFTCYVKDMKVSKSNRIETSSKYRSYSLTFKFTSSGYEFKLDPGGTFFRYQPRGIIKISSGNRYEMERYGNYQERFVNFSVSLNVGSISGTYYNWHSERGEFRGRVVDSDVELRVRGMHFKGKQYKNTSDSERDTNWVFDIPLTDIRLPRV